MIHWKDYPISCSKQIFLVQRAPYPRIYRSISIIPCHKILTFGKSLADFCVCFGRAIKSNGRSDTIPTFIRKHIWSRIRSCPIDAIRAFRIILAFNSDIWVGITNTHNVTRNSHYSFQKLFSFRGSNIDLFCSSGASNLGIGNRLIQLGRWIEKHHIVRFGLSKYRPCDNDHISWHQCWLHALTWHHRHPEECCQNGGNGQVCPRQSQRSQCRARLVRCPGQPERNIRYWQRNGPVGSFEVRTERIGRFHRGNTLVDQSISFLAIPFFDVANDILYTSVQSNLSEALASIQITT
mmetsp:Transcript_37784/g.79685  ORF Transcript_37784/g.79685 Transcript_37784/m.79685 type:complete len:294 (-) Transcript_37784:520-1401(-)